MILRRGKAGSLSNIANARSDVEVSNSAWRSASTARLSEPANTAVNAANARNAARRAASGTSCTWGPNAPAGARLPRSELLTRVVGAVYLSSSLCPAPSAKAGGAKGDRIPTRRVGVVAPAAGQPAGPQRRKNTRSHRRPGVLFKRCWREPTRRAAQRGPSAMRRSRIRSRHWSPRRA